MSPQPAEDRPISPQPAEDLVRTWLVDRPDASEGELGEMVRSKHPLLNTNRVQTVVSRALDRANGLGPLGQFMDSPDITEIMVNGPGRVWLDCKGSLVETSVCLDTDEIQVITERILDPLGLCIPLWRGLPDDGGLGRARGREYLLNGLRLKTYHRF